MKTFQAILIMLAAIIASCSAPQQAPPEEPKSPAQELEGAWKLTSAKFTYPDTVMEAGDYRPVKILANGRFAFGNQNTDSTLTAGGGTYEYDGQTYTENIEYFTNPNNVGQSFKFDIRLEGNTWYHSGSIPLDSGELLLEEVWERVE